MKLAVKAARRGMKGGIVDPIAMSIVDEYYTRMHLCKLGYRFDPKELTQLKCDLFRIVGNEINRLDEMESKKRHR